MGYFSSNRTCLKPETLLCPILLFLLLLFVNIAANAQNQTSLFTEQFPLELQLQVSNKQLRNDTNDTTYVKGEIAYKNQEGDWTFLKVDMRARGEFRRKNCYFPPIRIKIKKAEAKGTIFEGNRDLKLVLPCKTTKDKNELIVKEYMCYKFYEHIAPYAFQTRLTKINFTETTGKNHKQFELIGFFIEDINRVAKRSGAKKENELNPNPILLEDTTALRHDLFQFMIGNTDFSTAFKHNAKIVKVESLGKFVPVPYDFDMSGFVKAPYNIPDEPSILLKPGEREYRGFCRSNLQLLQDVRQEYLEKQSIFFEILSSHKIYLSNNEFHESQKYLEGFFSILKADKAFKEHIVDKCRTR